MFIQTIDIPPDLSDLDYAPEAEFTKEFSFPAEVDDVYVMLQGFSLGYDAGDGDHHFGIYNIRLIKQFDPFISRTQGSVIVRMHIDDDSTNASLIEGWLRIVVIGIKFGE